MLHELYIFHIQLMFKVNLFFPSVVQRMHTWREMWRFLRIK